MERNRGWEALVKKIREDRKRAARRRLWQSWCGLLYSLWVLIQSPVRRPSDLVLARMGLRRCAWCLDVFEIGRGCPTCNLSTPNSD